MLTVEIPGRGPMEVEHALRVGREQQWADVVLSGEGVSRHHLEIRATSDGYRVWDLGSVNGTTVNGRPVGVHGRALRVGDVVSAGKHEAATVLQITPPPMAAETRPSPDRAVLHVQLDDDLFVVTLRRGAEQLRDTMPFQLGLALSLLVLFRRDGLGPVPDVDMRALVWRGDAHGRHSGDINRLLLRLRSWFRQRGVEPPAIERAKGSFRIVLEMPSPNVQVHPDGWLYRFLDGA